MKKNNNSKITEYSSSKAQNCSVPSSSCSDFLSSEIGHKCLLHYIQEGIIQFDDAVNPLRRELILMKICNHIHKNSVIYEKGRNRFYTYLEEKNATGTRKRLYGKTETEVYQKVALYYAGLTSSKPNKTYNCNTISLNSIWSEYIDYIKKTAKNGTTIAYIKAYKRFYEGKDLADKPLKDLTKIDIKKFFKSEIEDKHLTYKSYGQMHVVLNQAYEYCIDAGYLDVNPVTGIQSSRMGLYSPKVKRSKDKAFSKKEAENINKLAFENFAKEPRTSTLGILLIFQTGLRRSEAAALTWDDIDLKNNLLYIHRMENTYIEIEEDGKTYGKCSHKIYEDSTKGKFGTRAVDLTDDAIYILNLFRDFHLTYNISSRFLLVDQTGKKLTDRSLEYQLKKLCKEAGMEVPKSLHKVRSTYISILREAGVSFKKIQEEVGHCSVQTTMNNYYSDIKEDDENLALIKKGLSSITTYAQDRKAN